MTDTTHGFQLINDQTLAELNARARLYRHVATGAEVLSLENADENKVFGIAFRTPPPDSTGLPHIMEHSVLCGSRKYPVKEPFVELMKGSLNTFLNAFTYSDKTCYPVASQNLQDFYNLIDVYLDAVFYPTLTPEVLGQEGWHYELETPDGALTYKGVVFNEMKGAYSSPENLVERYSERVLFPDNVYRHDSGGDPQVIPDLTFEQFMDFHRSYYHPSNARIFFYGDDDPAERLRLIEAYLKDFSAQPVRSEIGLQPTAEAPYRVGFSYPASDEAEQQKAFLTVNWLLPESGNSELALALSILSHILVGIPASPLRKALIDSGLGEDVIGDGLDDSLRQLTFAVGMKGIQPENCTQVETLILDTLEGLATQGIEPEMVEAALNTVEFQLREQNYGRFPRGLVLMLQALTVWLHGHDPIPAIAFERPLSGVKESCKAQPTYFEQLIRTHLLENPHRATMVLSPDPTLGQQQEAQERQRLEAARAAMTASGLTEVAEAARRIHARQDAPDSAEALAAIPSLGIEDLDKNPKQVPTEILQDEQSHILYHDLFTNGIVYLDLGFDLHTLPQALLPYVELFGAALLEIGTEREDFVKLTQRIARLTGGITAAPFTSMIRGSSEAAARLFLRGKATVERSDELLAILRDVLLTVKLDNRERFLQMLLEQKAQEEAGIVPAGHIVVAARLRAKFNEAHWASEQMSGVSYLLFLRQLIDQVAVDWPSVLEKLEEIRRILVNRTTMLCNVTVDGASWQLVAPKVHAFLRALPGEPRPTVRWEPAYVTESEGLTIPANVNYVGKGANLYTLGYQRHGSAEVISHYLHSTWLWEQVRVKGGAYGGFSVFDAHSGVFGFLSYRDPNLQKTLDIYDQTGAFLRKLELAEDELVKSIIGTIGAFDAYELPDAKGFGAMARHLVGYTEEARQQYRTELLSTTVHDFRAFADVLDEVKAAGRIVVLGPREAIETASSEAAQPYVITRVL